MCSSALLEGDTREGERETEYLGVSLPTGIVRAGVWKGDANKPGSTDEKACGPSGQQMVLGLSLWRNLLPERRKCVQRAKTLKSETKTHSDDG